MKETIGKFLNKCRELLSEKPKTSHDYADDIYNQVYQEQLAWVKKNPELVAQIFTDDRLRDMEREAEQKWFDENVACKTDSVKAAYEEQIRQTLDVFINEKMIPFLQDHSKDEPEMERD